MSETPRTDNTTGSADRFGDRDVVSANFARTLERELAASQTRVKEMEADKVRLDWLGAGISDGKSDAEKIIHRMENCEQLTLRASIDAAMKGHHE